MSFKNSVCWSCRGVTPAGVFCHTCDTILPMDPGENFFQLFHMEPAFDLDLAALEQHYRELQKKLHPDFFAQRSAMERRISMERVIRLNEAWQTLQDPLLRSGYLLQTLGWQAVKPEPDPEFLYEVMALRETLEEVNPMESNALSRLAALRSEAKARMQTTIEKVSEMFRVYLTEKNGEILSKIARYLDRMRYHRRYLEELDRLEDQAFEQES
ncbi:MAG: Fe-S protein assembly co-chaperone HscB [Magnetococcales bacterium]|nr:Fe-S protein assembly co-chaperone HscB [Magnetococcales bacterium]